MKKFNESTTLFALCNKIIEIKYEKTKITTNKKDELVKIFYKYTKNLAYNLYNKNKNLYIDEITKPEKLFYLKGGKDWGFCKEFLEIPEIKKYKDNFLKIIKEKKEIEELDQATKTYTKNKFNTFIKFYIASVKNREEKICFKIAKDILTQEIEDLLNQMN